MTLILQSKMRSIIPLLQFTAACIFLLEAEGKLSLKDPIQKFLPEIPVYAGDTVRIHHLVHHISGLRDYVEIMACPGGCLNGGG